MNDNKISQRLSRWLALGAGVWWLVSRRSRRAAEIARADAPQDGAALAAGHRMLDGD
jgi:hypothetical protein